MERLTVRSSEVEKLDRLVGAPPASVYLIATDYDHYALKTLASALTQHGAALAALEISLAFPQRPFTHDLRGFDFVAACPHLTTLSVGRCGVNASVLLHPALEEVRLDDGWLYTPDPLRLGYPDSPASRVTRLHLNGVNWGNRDEDLLGRLAFGPRSPLHTFSYYLDEDDVELYPEEMLFEGCPHLAELTVHICGGWLLKLKGDLPALKDVDASSRPYGDHHLSFHEIGDHSSDYALHLRKGVEHQ